MFPEVFSSSPSPPPLQIIMFNQPAVLHAFLDHLTTALITYVGYQIEAGAQVVQLFDSWAHHLSPEQFAEFSLPYANRVIEEVRAKYPHVPLIFHANGGEASSKGLVL
jgi:uroporphyrinogen-III decarboxylase